MHSRIPAAKETPMARTHRRVLMSLGVLFILGACSPTTSSQRISTGSPALPVTQAAIPSSAAMSRTDSTLIPEIVPAPAAVSTSKMSPTRLAEASPTAQPAGPPRITPIALPDGTGGIGFDDLCYDPTLDRLLVPAGRTGKLDLVDPQTLVVTSISGFSAQPRFSGGHDEGIT
jgi:hypothetical protein